MKEKKVLILLFTLLLCVCMISATMVSCMNTKETEDGIIKDGELVDPDDKDCTNHVDKNGDGKCDKCGATMQEENPPCTDHVDNNGDGYCDKCGESMGNVGHQHVDANGDGKCDDCGITMSSGGHQHVDANGDGKCDICGGSMGNVGHQHVDADGDDYCDDCGKFISCTKHVDEDGDGYCDKCGVEMPIDDTAVRELFGVLDDFVANTGNIENVGVLGTDSEILFEVEQDGITKKLKIEFDVALDLLRTGMYSDMYGNNGLSMVVSIDNGSGTYDRLFGIWYLNGDSDDNSKIYLDMFGQGLIIDAFAIANVLEKYNVNANIPVGDKIGDNMLTDVADGYIGTFASIIDLEFVEIDGVKTFTLDIKELLNPDSVIAALLDSLIFKEEGSILENLAGINVSQILKDLNVGISCTEDVYNIIPDMSLVVKGNYEQDKFVSLSVGLDVKGSEDGINIPTVDGNIVNVVSSFGDTSLKTTFKAEFLTNDEAFGNVESLYSAVAAEAEEEQWADIGVLNFAFDAQVTLGTDKDSAKTYDIQLAADINAAAVADATFTKRVYYTDANGDYVKGADGNYLYTDWFYLKGGIFGNEQDTDVVRALLPAINSFYLKMVNVNDPSDVLMINVLEKFTVNSAGDITGGKLYVKLAALNNICSAFGIDLKVMLGDMADTILGMDGEVPYNVVSAALGMLSGMLYTIPEEYLALGATEMTATAPKAMASATADEVTDGSNDTTTGGTGIKDVVATIFEVIDKIKASVTMGTDSITAANAEDVDYTIGGAAITFDMTGSVLRNDAKKVDGIKVVTNAPFVTNYNDGEVVTSIGANVQIGHGELFTAEVTVNQDKAGVDALDIYIDFTLNKIGYGCAVRTPVQLDGENPVGSIYREGAGIVLSK